MDGISTLLATAAITMGAVAVAKRVKRRASRHWRRMTDSDEAQSPVIDLEADTQSGIWRVPGRTEADPS
ncbi:hypothetical protein [Parvularcula sp. LCG005]|uniref:hypothetical protein n=1 Tax=Parvularcula sp. LCG005 TaxID=3078805 RepID=UPI0029437584|nr:hypothetical protein [Parvularcula sp. LCG005]WOI52100.1 hypothetical protein RUI03_08010 [Parvularcula sp. LCG005]